MKIVRAPTLAARVGLAALTIAILASATPAQAKVPVTPNFGPLIEDYAGYHPQDTCKPKPKPGVVAFKNLVLETYPTTHKLHPDMLKDLNRWVIGHVNAGHDLYVR